MHYLRSKAIDFQNGTSISSSVDESDPDAAIIAELRLLNRRVQAVLWLMVAAAVVSGLAVFLVASSSS